MPNTPGLAIFDLDYTLTQKGTWGRFVVQTVKSRPHLWLPLLVSAGLAQFRYKQGKIPRVDVKRAMMKWCMTGKSKTELTAIAEKFAKNEVENGLRPGAIATLVKHRENGDAILIVSAAVDILVNPIAQKLDIKHAMSTEMDWSDDDKLLPTFKTPNCYGKEKLRRLELYLTENEELKQNHTHITMYSDSYSDLEILTYADLGVAVNPDKRLRAVAKEHKLKIVDWNT